MRWPWQRNLSQDRTVVSWSAGTLAYVRARLKGDGTFEVSMAGVERQGADSMDDFVRRLQALGLKGGRAWVMLRADQYQLLQIQAPPVPPEELRAAARFQIREMVNTHIDDITMDVMRVGDGQNKAADQLFVVAALTAMVSGALDLAQALQWDVNVIDVQETAQRNLQSALARRESRLEKADALLMIAGDRQALLTISAGEELFFSRRLDLPDGFMAMQWSQNSDDAAPVVDTYTPVGEYVPDYSVGGTSHGNDYSSGQSTSSGGADHDKAQRVLVEVQRSLDLWDRAWSSMPLSGLHVAAGERSSELAQWLSRELGQSVVAIDLNEQFGALSAFDPVDQAYCLPLLGVLLRTETRKL
jgi:MSHA biogenesis protein MshI